MSKRENLLELKQIMDKAITFEKECDERLIRHIDKVKTFDDANLVEVLSQYQIGMRANTEDLIAIRAKFVNKYGL